MICIIKDVNHKEIELIITKVEAITGAHTDSHKRIWLSSGKDIVVDIPNYMKIKTALTNLL